MDEREYIEKESWEGRIIKSAKAKLACLSSTQIQTDQLLRWWGVRVGGVPLGPRWPPENSGGVEAVMADNR